MDILEIIESFERINIHEAIAEVFEETANEMVEMNRKQLEEGIRDDGDRIHWLKDSHYPYTIPYAKRRERFGLQTSVVNLNFSGNLWDEMEARVESDSIEFGSRSDVSEFQEENYSKEIYGMTDENTESYINESFSSRFAEKIEEQAGVNL